MNDNQPKAWRADWEVRDARNVSLTFAHKSVLMVLASRINAPDEEAFPSVETLAADAGGAERQTKTLLTDLITWGVLRKRVETHRGGRRNRYTIDFGVLAQTAPYAPIARPSRHSPFGKPDGSGNALPDGSGNALPDGSGNALPEKIPSEAATRSYQEKLPSPPATQAVVDRAPVRVAVAEPAGPSSAPAQAQATLSLFADTALTVVRPGKPALKTRSRRPENYAYVEAFDAGQFEASAIPCATPKGYPGKTALIDALKAHAPDLRGEAVIVWIRETSAAYRKARPGDAHYGGHTPQAMLKWLNGGRLGANAGRATGSSGGIASDIGRFGTAAEQDVTLRVSREAWRDREPDPEAEAISRELSPERT